MSFSTSSCKPDARGSESRSDFSIFNLFPLSKSLLKQMELFSLSKTGEGTILEKLCASFATFSLSHTSLASENHGS